MAEREFLGRRLNRGKLKGELDSWRNCGVRKHEVRSLGNSSTLRALEARCIEPVEGRFRSPSALPREKRSVETGALVCLCAHCLQVCMCFCVHMCIQVRACLFTCVYACMCLWECARVSKCTCVDLRASLCVCVCVCTRARSRWVVQSARRVFRRRAGLWGLVPTPLHLILLPGN